jgi:hypothetical protein
VRGPSPCRSPDRHVFAALEITVALRSIATWSPEKAFPETTLSPRDTPKAVITVGFPRFLFHSMSCDTAAAVASHLVKSAILQSLIKVPRTPTIPQVSRFLFFLLQKSPISLTKPEGYSRPYAKSASEDLGSMDTWDHFRGKSKRYEYLALFEARIIVTNQPPLPAQSSRCGVRASAQQNSGGI